MRNSVLCGAGTAGGSSRLLTGDYSIEKISECDHVLQRHGDPSSHYIFSDDPSVEKVGGQWSGMSERQGSEIAMRIDVKPTIAKRLLNVIRINYRNWFF